MAVLWIPLLVFAGITVITQFATFGYCIKVYLAALSDDSTATENSGLPSYTSSIRGTISPKQAYRRVKRVLELQWRGIGVVLLIVTDVIFFAIIFVFMDDIAANIIKNPEKSAAWLACLIQKEGDKNQCLDLAKHIVVNQATVMAVLFLLSVNGIWCLCLLGRLSMFTGWVDLIRHRVKPNNEFVSADAHQYKDPSSYEMLGRDRGKGDIKTPEPFVATPNAITPLSPVAKSGRETPDYFGREARYKSPSRSFSSPKPPPGQFAPNTHSWNSQTSTPIEGTGSKEWDSVTPHAQSTYYVGMDPLAMNKI